MFRDEFVFFYIDISKSKHLKISFRFCANIYPHKTIYSK